MCSRKASRELGREMFPEACTVKVVPTSVPEKTREFPRKVFRASSPEPFSFKVPNSWETGGLQTRGFGNSKTTQKTKQTTTAL